jgi:dTDP-4-amino-4,6-dideoxygalactose transaminase
MNVHEITAAFEKLISDYTGAPYCICLDSQSNALFLSLIFDNIKGKTIEIPSHTYMSVPCEIIHAGGKVKFHQSSNKLKGAYWLKGSRVIDSALKFTADMYVPGSFMCCSFTGPVKHLKLEKGGCILTDNKEAYDWFTKARYSGRNPVPYHLDSFDMTGWNFWLIPSIATRGVELMKQFYNPDGSKRHIEDIEHEYPDLSCFPIYTK